MSTTIDIHNVTRIYVLDELKPRQQYETARRTILIVTENDTHSLEITMYSKANGIPVIIGDQEDE
jgi:hypothetical protein